MKYFLVAACLVLLTSCDDNSAKSSNSDADTPLEDQQNNEDSHIQAIADFPLAEPSQALAEISNISGLQKISADWIVGHWAASSQLMSSDYVYDRQIRVKDYLYSFNADGSFSLQSLMLGVNEDALSDENGSWSVYYHSGADRYYLFLNVNNTYLADIPLERDGDNTLRIQTKYRRPLERSKLLTRLGSTSPAIYPGMGLLGTYEYRDYFGPDDQFLYVYKFTDDGQVSRIIYGDYHYNGALHSSSSGSWAISDDGQTLLLNLDGENTIRFAISRASVGNLTMFDETGDDQYWSKTEEPVSIDSYKPIVGEYRERDGNSYVSISKTGEDYFVDIWSEYLPSQRFLSMPVTLLDNGELSFIIPEGVSYDMYTGKEVRINVDNNKLRFIKVPKGFISSIDDMDKVSSHPRHRYDGSIIGGWSHALGTRSSGYAYLHFLDGGTLHSGAINGHNSRYEQNGTLLKTQITCEKPVFKELSNLSGNLEIDTINYAPIPGTAALGSAGSEITRIMFEHSYDRYGLENAPKLKAHPDISNAYLYIDEVRYDAIYANFTLKPDGTGRFFSGSVDYYEDSLNGDWLGSETSGGLFSLQYFVMKDQGKEYLVYYYSGAFTGDYDNIVTLGSVEQNIRDAKVAEIYNRRTAICYPLSTSGDGSGVVMPLEKE